MTVREQIHDLIETLPDDRVAELLLELEFTFGEAPPLSAEDIASIERGLEQAARGEGIPLADVRRHFGLPD
jgi:hypothetical protein